MRVFDGSRGRAPAKWSAIAQVRRARILDAAVDVVSEEGFAGASVTAVCERARVSRQAFYDVFDGRESCFLAVLDEGHRRVGMVVSKAFDGVDEWLAGVRAALAELLLFFDSEPRLARVCIVEALAAGPWALQRRERHVASLTQSIVGHWGELFPQEPYPFANVGVMVSVLAIIQNHLLAGGPDPLIGLLGPLMGHVSAPYLDAREAACEVERGEQIAREMLERRCSRAPGGADSGVQVPDVLLSARAHRARLCLLYVAEQGGRGICPSNQQVAAGIGVSHRGQVSVLLGRLAGMGLLVKRAGRPGHPNAWSLSTAGEQVALALRRR